jgi:acrylyl-CoA reductase (NADPH)
MDLGASQVIGRFDPPGRPLASGRWAGVVDGVGGDTLAAILPEMAYGGSVAAYGLAGGTALNTTVLPFILRGVKLLGVDSVMCPVAPRRAAWDRLASVLPVAKLDAMTQVEPLSAVMTLGERILAGDVRGRVVLDVEK